MSMRIELKDKSKEWRSDEEIKAARSAIQNALMKFKGDSEIMIHYPVIIEALQELLIFRELIKKGKTNV